MDRRVAGPGWVAGWLAALLACTPAPPRRSGPAPAVPRAEAEQFVTLETIEPYTPYLQRLRAHKTAQTGAGPISGARLPSTPRGATLVSYPSAGRRLPGWLLEPPAGTERLGVGVVYLHNDFALTRSSYENALPFVDAGFVVLLPTLRAENGNAGDFQLLLGEVDDAKAAVAWLADQPTVDAGSLYVIGHSIGGGIAALLCLHPDLRARLTASIGGIYRARTFSSWAHQSWNRHLVRFDPLDKAEVSLRLLGPNVRDIVRPHVAYAGSEDVFARRYATHVAGLARPHGADFSVVVVDGDHMASARQAVEHFIQVIRTATAT